MSDNIPFDIQTEIIKRVSDAKSLIRFRSVSKSWRSYIDNPKFIAFYGVRQTHSLHLRYKEAGYLEKKKYLSFVDDVQQDFSPNVPLLIKLLYNSSVIGSSCGLLCLHGYKNYSTEMAIIWNPTIRKSVGIVLPRFPSLPDNDPIIAFGVCPSTYDSTIVGISYATGKILPNSWEGQIFTLSSKTWKMIPSSNMPRGTVRLRPTPQVAIDRFIFWAATGMFGGYGDDGIALFLKNLIISFDLITHEFKEVYLPESIANGVILSDDDQVPLDFSVSKLNESLVVCAYINEVNVGRVYGVWMMEEEGGVMKSFKKVFTINIRDLSTRRILGFGKNGEPIMQTVKQDEGSAALEVYEPCSEHINNLGIYGVKDSLFIFPYEETLLLADHSGGCIISTIIEGKNDGYVQDAEQRMTSV